MAKNVEQKLPTLATEHSSVKPLNPKRSLSTTSLIRIANWNQTITSGEGREERERRREKGERRGERVEGERGGERGEGEEGEREEGAGGGERGGGRRGRKERRTSNKQ